MTGSAFPMHIGRGTLYLRLAPQDNIHKYSTARGKRGCPAASGRRLADDGKRLCDLIAARNVVIRVAPQDNLHQY